ncbi:glycoside hydrolase family 15 protein [Microbacter margulisiae]|nr:glycoside hydrolase family 15 protein [Microbacter margulisiae]
MDNLDYAVIGNCRSAALVSKEGSIDWCCLPDFDSPSVFAKILDKEKGGQFSIEVDSSYVISQNYMYHTNVVVTKFKSPKGSFSIIDFMPRYKTEQEYFTPPEIYRYIRFSSGKPSFKIRYRPKLNYGEDDVKHIKEDNYIRSQSVISPTDCVYLYTSIDPDDILNENEIALTTHQFLLLSYNQKIINVDLERVYTEFQRTKVYWLNLANRSKKFEKYTEEMTRSILILKMLSFQSTGAVLAALTTSIPETLGEVRNWDYRFCWLRDASMAIDTLLKMGHNQAARRFMGYIKGILRSKHDTFQIMYGIRGERDLMEVSLPHLSGYEDSKPVRIGNNAFSQRQNDVFGYLLNVIYQYYNYFPGMLDEVEEMWEIVRNIIRTVSNVWEKPDQGIWEIRNEEKHFVFSKIMCWVALDRAIKIAKLLNKPYYVQLWSGIANRIKEDVLTKGWNESLQTFTQTYDNTELDASLLIMAEYGFIEANDPKYVGTVLACQKELFHNDLMYRYVNHDDFGKPSSSFTIGTFWLVQALARIGKKDEAQTIFNKLLRCSNHVGLFSEDIDFTTKRLLGNFPQAYSHLALINTAMLFSDERKASKFIKP